MTTLLISFTACVVKAAISLFTRAHTRVHYGAEAWIVWSTKKHMQPLLQFSIHVHDITPMLMFCFGQCFLHPIWIGFIFNSPLPIHWKVSVMGACWFWLPGHQWKPLDSEPPYHIQPSLLPCVNMSITVQGSTSALAR